MRRQIRILAFFLAAFTMRAMAQTAHFNGVQSIVGSSGQFEPGGVAVDASGNVYVSDENNGTVYKETLSATGTYIQSTVASGLKGPSALALDGSGNIYIIVTGDGQAVSDAQVLKETLSGGTYSQSVVVAGGLATPNGLAIDGNANLYITDGSGFIGASTYVSPRLLKETLSNGSYVESTVAGYPIYNWGDGVAVDGSGNLYVGQGAEALKETPSSGGYTQSTLLSIQGNVYGFALDSGGNLYISDSSTPRGFVFKETLSAGIYTQSTIGTDLNYPTAVALDKNGNVYIADALNYRVLKETPSGGSFGTVNVGSPSTRMTWIFTFDTAGTIGTPVVLTGSSKGLDFADAGTGSCTTNGTTYEYNIGDTCTVDVVFTPTTAGTRIGTVQLIDNSGKVIATGPAQGVGQASGTTLDFAIASPGSGTPSVTASAGGQAVYPFVISPTGGTGMPGVVSLSVTGLPAGATAVFSPSTLSAGAGSTNVILLVTLPTQSATQAFNKPFGGSFFSTALCLILLPFAGKWRKSAKRFNGMAWIVVVGLCSVAMIAGLTGCGASSSPSTSAQRYTLTITATSGSLSHSTTATLIVK